MQLLGLVAAVRRMQRSTMCDESEPMLAMHHLVFKMRVHMNMSVMTLTLSVRLLQVRAMRSRLRTSILMG